MLLAHDQHMTEVMERAHGGPVAVQVLARRRAGDAYARLITLTRPADGAVVQGGLVRIHLDRLPADLAAAILREDTPLGRLLIDHHVLRRIEVQQFLRFPSTPELERWLGPLHGQATYGRLGYLHVDGQPVVELFEILAAPSLGAMDA